MTHPVIIQGGMGVAVSGWRLARAVSQAGQLGVVSGTALTSVLARRLQLGDPDGAMRRALEHFPVPGVAESILAKYFIPGGKAPDAPFRLAPMPSVLQDAHEVELTVLANFAEVYLAKEGHAGLVGVNFLEKIQCPTLPSIFGAMLANVDYVIMGAGIPRAIPGILDKLARGEPVEMKIDVEGALPGEEFHSKFDPVAFCGGKMPAIRRPPFFAIVSSATLAMTLARKASGRVDGFIVEGERAGGHNAPPRGPMQLNERGEPIYGPRDVPELDKIRALGLPFWLAGSYGHKDKLAEALSLGAAGVQVGTAFAYCEESGIRPELKRQVLELSRAGHASVFTDPNASPTGFPFKVAQVGGSISEQAVYEQRVRVCDLGYLRHVYRRADGKLGYRCPSEPASAYVLKGGAPEEANRRVCICNGLFATIGLGQVRNASGVEPALITAGDDLATVAEFLPPGRDSYTAADVIRALGC